LNHILIKRLSAAVLLLSVTSLITCSAAFADTGNTTPFGDGGSGSVYWMLVKVIGFLAVIIAIFLFIMKFVAQKNRAFHSGRSIKPIGGLSLGQNKSVQVVQIGHSVYVLGVGTEVQLVDRIDDPEEIAYIEDNAYAGGAAGQGFPSMGEWLKKLTNKTPKTEEWDVPSSSSFQAVFQEKIQRLSNRQKQVEELMVRQSQEERLKDNHE